MTDAARKGMQDLVLADRRRARRACLDGTAAAVTVEGLEVETRFRDVSRTGFAFTTNRLLAPGTELEFEGLLRSLGEESVFVSCRAIVVRCDREAGNIFLVGCHYLAMSARCRDLIDDFVEAVQTKDG